ncbi:MAG: DUF6125 family protein [Desulfobacteraceae bacterium]|jgi:hypothetical protein
MQATVHSMKDLNQEQKARLVADFFHRTVVHYGLWFAEARHQFGLEKAMEMLSGVFPRSSGIQVKRLGKTLGFATKDGLPEALSDLPEPQMDALLDALAVNWLANDGVWFQAVEFANGMNDAKRCNDSCWGHFSPVEAASIKRFLSLDPQPGLEGLKKALNFRLYARVNTQSFHDEGPGSFVFQMNACRVQDARKRKGLDDYPCKSGGLVEYSTFATAIDSRIKTECVGCPPDDHPEEWYCAWRFVLNA